MGYYIDQLAEQDRQNRLASLLAAGEAGSFPAFMPQPDFRDARDLGAVSTGGGIPSQAMPQGGLLADLLKSGASRDDINAMLSQSTQTTPGFRGNTMSGSPYMPETINGEQYGMATPGVRQAPENMIRNNSTGRVFSPVGIDGQPSQSQPAGPALDYSSPIEMGGMGKGYRLKGDSTRAIINGQMVSMGRDTGADRARTLEDLKMAKARQELESGGLDAQAKRIAIMEAMGQDPAMMAQGGGMPQARDQSSQRYLQRQFGKVPVGFRRTQDGGLEPEPGGPNDEKGRVKREGADDVNASVAALRDAYSRLEKGGGITSTEKGPMDNAMAAASSSALGQAVGKTFGTQNQSARNDVAMMRPALLAAMMKATGMSAKQMDSNAELKLWLSTATDPTLDVESNRRALANIERKYLRASGQGNPGGGASGSFDAPAAGGSQDAQALAWANANPNDPRAAKIKAKLGVQ